VYYANQLPDVTEPRFDGRVYNFLNLLGRGVWYGTPARTTRPALLGTLFMLNSFDIMSRSLTQPTGGFVALDRAARLAAQDISDQELVKQLFLATLVRYPTDSEVQTVLAAKGANRFVWVANVHWALMNKMEFLFN
jgi:hypothetical protein